ncbi:uncharacterized protein JCM10292_005679 [Rhodotorula paludigena]|uniref:uncharacterized protein n=1 Tax=Rhodotorula paludigena TaxID=86838 RepID=UPI00317F82A2
MTAVVLQPARAGLHRPHDSDDLLAVKLDDDGNPVDDHPDWTGDLEDLLSLSVARQLHSKRSQPAFNALPPSTPTSSSPSSRLADPRPRTASAIPVSASLARSPSAPGRKRPSDTLRQSPERTVASQQNAANTGELGEDAVEHSAGGWETLQVGVSTGARRDGAPSSALNDSTRRARSPGSSTRAAQTTPMARAKTLDFPASGASGSKGPTRTTPSAPRALPSSTTGSPSGTPRKRAVTQSPSSTPSPSVTTARRPAGTSRLGASVTSSPASSVPVGARSSPRRKSLSTASPSSRARPPAPADLRRTPSSDRLRAVQLAESEFHSEPPALPPWSDSPAPLVYRTSKGELSFAYDAAAREEGAAPRRPEDRVLPAVARRLEAERLRKLAEAAGIGEEGGRAEEGGKGWLVSEWDREGLPRRAVAVEGGARAAAEGDGSSAPAQAVRQGASPDEERDDSATQHPLQHTTATPPRASSRPLDALASAAPPSPAAYSSAHPTSPPQSPSYPPGAASVPSADATYPPTGGALAHSALPSQPQPQHQAQSAPPAATQAPRRDKLDRDASSAGCCRCIIS